MTEEEWLSEESSGRLLEQTKRITDLTPRARARKNRRAAIEIAREYLPADPDPRIVAVLDAADRACDGHIPFVNVSAVVRAANFPPRSDTWPNWGAFIGHFDFGVTDAFASVRGIAGHTQLGPKKEYWSTVGGRPPFVAVQCCIIRDIFGNPFRPVAFSPAWRTDTATAIARGMYESRDFGAMPILADALQDSGCDNENVLNHCRDANAAHVRGCWVVDLALGKK